MRAPATPYVGGVCIKHGIIVSLAIFRECLYDVSVRRVAIRLEGADDHPEAAVRHDGPFQRRLSLQPHDDFILAIDIAWTVRDDGTRNLRDIEHSLASFLYEQFVQADRKSVV